MTKLPADLLTDSVLLVGSGKTSCLGGIRRGTQGVCAHMGNSRGLPRGSGGCRCYGSVHVTSGAATDKSATDLLGDIKLTASEGSCPGDRVTGPAILWSFRLEQPQHPLCAVRCPHRDDPPIDFAQRLRRPHTPFFHALPRAEAPDDLDCVLKRPASTNQQNYRPLQIGGADFSASPGAGPTPGRAQPIICVCRLARCRGGQILVPTPASGRSERRNAGVGKDAHESGKRSSGHTPEPSDLCGLRSASWFACAAPLDAKGRRREPRLCARMAL